MRRPVVLVMVATAVTAAAMVPSMARAQSAGADDLLDVPRGAIACHEKAVTVRDSAASVFQVVDAASAERPRSMLFGFDSAGTPRYGMVTREDLSDSTRFVEEVLAARFAEHVAGARLRAVNGEVDVSRATADSVPGMPHGAIPLTADEMARTTALARWIWARRCSASRMHHSSPPAAAPMPPTR